MARIPVDGLIAVFRKMYDERWTYAWGAARQGCVDCSGAFVYAYGRFGQTVPHGSNAIARSCVGKLLPVSDARPGMAAFKRKKPGQSGYDLPDRYKSSPDQNDYYHIGLVDQTGRYVLNAQGEKAGFTRTPVGKWAFVAELKAVDYASGASADGDGGPVPDPTPEPAPAFGEALVTAPSGSLVNVRTKPGGAKQDALPIGTAVTVLETRGDWSLVDYHRQGWMMTRYLAERGEGVG